jgi:hypothetical protein
MSRFRRSVPERSSGYTCTYKHMFPGRKYGQGTHHLRDDCNAAPDAVEIESRDVDSVVDDRALDRNGMKQGKGERALATSGPSDCT